MENFEDQRRLREVLYERRRLELEASTRPLPPSGWGRTSAWVWKARTLMHTLAMGDSAKLATCLAADIAGWLEDESCAVPLEVFEPEGRWRPATRALAAGPGPSDMLSVFQSATAFNINKRPM